MVACDRGHISRSCCMYDSHCFNDGINYACLLSFLSQSHVELNAYLNHNFEVEGIFTLMCIGSMVPTCVELIRAISVA